MTALVEGEYVNAFGYALAIQPSDGKILVGGEQENDLAMARFHSANGFLDSTFDSDVTATYNLGGIERIEDIAIQADGKILVAGVKGSDMIIARINDSDGSLDTGYGASSGYTAVDIGTSTSDAGYGLAIQADCKPVVAGVSAGGFAVARFTISGILDTKFDSDGNPRL